MQVHCLGFDGKLLARGFWLYAWKVDRDLDSFIYVGRTGDSSSKNAASPFSRLSRHLDALPSASANMLFRHVTAKGWDPTECSYQLVAFGPIFPEQSDIGSHRVVRDIVAPLETALAALFSSRGWEVRGAHGTIREPDADLLKQVHDAFAQAFAKR